MLGYGFASWKREELRTVIDYCGGKYRRRASKPELWDELKIHANIRGLSKADRISILRGSHIPEGLTSFSPVSATRAEIKSEQVPVKQEPRESCRSSFRVPQVTHPRVSGRDSYTRRRRRKSNYRSFAGSVSSAVHDTQPNTFTAGIEAQSDDTPQRDDSEEFKRSLEGIDDFAEIKPQVDVSRSPEVVEIVEDVEDVHDRACTVCYQNLDTDNLPVHKVTSTCQHEPDIYKTCLVTSIAT